MGQFHLLQVVAIYSGAMIRRRLGGIGVWAVALLLAGGVIAGLAAAVPALGGTPASGGALASGETPASGGTPGGMAAVDYDLAAAPARGLETLSYPLTVLRNASATAYWYWADEFNFTAKGTAYFGLQPNGQYGRTGLFSVFGQGTAKRRSWCVNGADAGPGTSCHIRYRWVVGRTYRLTVRLSSQAKSTRTWLGTVRNLASGVTTTLGAWSVPRSWGLLQRASGGFAEYFGPVSSCRAIPQMVVRYGAPTGTAGSRTYRGIVTQAYGYGSSGGGYIDCKSAAHVSHTRYEGFVKAPRNVATLKR